MAKDSATLLEQPADPALPAYHLRVSLRARYIRLRVLGDGTLELVLPKGARPEEGEAFLRQQLDWVARMQARAARHQKRHRAARDRIPKEVRLTALEEHWRLEPATGQGGRTALRVASPGVLQLHGCADDPEAVRGLLRAWLRQRAQQVLPEWLAAEAARTGLRYQRVGIRLQKTRWGSCSARNAISLNAKLLFLPREQVQYVLVHELCHTREHNHSPAFWALVERHLPGGREIDRRLRQADRYVPEWMLCD